VSSAACTLPNAEVLYIAFYVEYSHTDIYPHGRTRRMLSYDVDPAHRYDVIVIDKNHMEDLRDREGYTYAHARRDAIPAATIIHMTCI
jgi:hypothetical protein